jgi:hypothetical protein
MKVQIKPSTRKDKKFMAIFFDGDKKVKTTHFGAKNMSDFTIHKDKEMSIMFTFDNADNRHKDDEKYGELTQAMLDKELDEYIEKLKNTIIENIK